MGNYSPSQSPSLSTLPMKTLHWHALVGYCFFFVRGVPSGSYWLRWLPEQNRDPNFKFYEGALASWWRLRNLSPIELWKHARRSRPSTFMPTPTVPARYGILFCLLDCLSFPMWSWWFALNWRIWSCTFHSSWDIISLALVELLLSLFPYSREH